MKRIFANTNSRSVLVRPIKTMHAMAALATAVTFVAGYAGTASAQTPNPGGVMIPDTGNAGGGPSVFESRPAYQDRIQYNVGSQRGVPDVALDANPNTGVWVLDNFNAASTCGGTPCWYVVGDTSVGTPAWAGVVNAAGSLAASTNAELTRMYNNGGSGFNDITVGTCGPYNGYFALPGWDFCSGLGSAESYYGK